MEQSSFSSGEFLDESSSSTAEKIRELSHQTDLLGEAIVQFYADNNYEDVVVDKCMVPVELNAKYQEVMKQLREHQEKQVRLNDEIEEEISKISLLKLQIANNEKAQQTLLNLKNIPEVKSKQEELTAMLNRHSQQETDTFITINTAPLQEQLHLKLKNQNAMIGVLLRQIEQEKFTIREHQRERQQYERKLAEMSNQDDEWARKEADDRLMADTVRNYEQAIARMERVIEYHENRVYN